MLLSSVYGPYAEDSEVSRAANPMELYHNQVTREQGAFSLRMHHRSFGLMLIQSNLRAPCTLLDFPTLDRFREELRGHRYDVIGISGIIPNLQKVQVMCKLARELQPHATIVVGGHVANYPGVATLLDADHIVLGEGVSWMRRFLGEDASQPIVHPAVLSGLGARTMGVPLSDKPGEVAALVMCSVGCPMGCNFCATSAMFGGKGSSIHFYESGEALFEVMLELERKLQVRSFFMMDENFLLYRRRALRLLELMEEHGKPWSLYVFSSAHVLAKYTMDQLVRLGISWVWMGLEGEDACYDKLRGIDTREVVRGLQAHGVRVLGSSIIGLETHTPENIDRVIDFAVAHETDFHQFMLYTPLPGTPLHRVHEAAGDLRSDVPAADMHGQTRFNFHHPHLRDGREGELLARAFACDFQVNGPSVMRIARTTLRGWRRHKEHPSSRVRTRFAAEARDLSLTHAAGLWAASRRFRADNPPVAARLSEVLGEVVREMGWRSRLVAPLAGRYLLRQILREETRLRRGEPHEPPTFYEHNEAALRLAASAESVERQELVSLGAPSVAPDAAGCA